MGDGRRGSNGRGRDTSDGMAAIDTRGYRMPANSSFPKRGVALAGGAFGPRPGWAALAKAPFDDPLLAVGNGLLTRRTQSGVPLLVFLPPSRRSLGQPDTGVGGRSALLTRVRSSFAFVPSLAPKVARPPDAIGGGARFLDRTGRTGRLVPSGGRRARSSSRQQGGGRRGGGPRMVAACGGRPMGIRASPMGNPSDVVVSSCRQSSPARHAQKPLGLVRVSTMQVATGGGTEMRGRRWSIDPGGFHVGLLILVHYNVSMEVLIGRIRTRRAQLLPRHQAHI